MPLWCMFRSNARGCPQSQGRQISSVWFVIFAVRGNSGPTGADCQVSGIGHEEEERKGGKGQQCGGVRMILSGDASYS